MSAIVPQALAKFIGQLYVATLANPTVFTRLGSVRGLANPNTYEKVEIKADDTGTVVTFSKPASVIECTFLETADSRILDLLLPGTRTVNAGAPTPVVDESLNAQLASSATWAIGETLVLANKNGDDSEVASIVVTNNAVALVLNTDYAVGVDPQGNTTVIGILATATAGTGIEVDYTYTPNANVEFAFTKEQSEMPQLVAKIEAPIPSTSKKRIITLTDCIFGGEYRQEFLDVVEAGDITGSPISFDLNDGGQYLYHDEENVL